MITVQEVAVASYKKGTVARDTYGDINNIARVYGITKEVALTAAKNEATLRDLADQDAATRDPRKPETEAQKLEKICRNRRRKWDCFHIAAAQHIGCQEFYTTDADLLKCPDRLGIRSLRAMPPSEPMRTIKGDLFK